MSWHGNSLFPCQDKFLRTGFSLSLLALLYNHVVIKYKKILYWVLFLKVLFIRKLEMRLKNLLF